MSRNNKGHLCGSLIYEKRNKIANPIINKQPLLENKIVSRYYQFKVPKICLRCMVATLGPWHYYTSPEALRQHMRECIYPFSIILFKSNRGT